MLYIINPIQPHYSQLSKNANVMHIEDCVRTPDAWNSE